MGAQMFKAPSHTDWTWAASRSGALLSHVLVRSVHQPQHPTAGTPQVLDWAPASRVPLPSSSKLVPKIRTKIIHERGALGLVLGAHLMGHSKAWWAVYKSTCSATWRCPQHPQGSGARHTGS